MSLFTAPIRILAVAALCAAALIGLVVTELSARESGTEVLIAMQPVDPRNLLSGHYVNVFMQEELPEGAPCPETLLDADSAVFGDNVQEEWLAIAPNGDRHSVVGSAATREEAAELGSILVRGASACMMTTATPEGDPAVASISTNLGLERFYVDQANAERIERIQRASAGAEEVPVLAIVSIDANGRARMKGLLVEGERLELTLD